MIKKYLAFLFVLTMLTAGAGCQKSDTKDGLATEKTPGSTSEKRGPGVRPEERQRRRFQNSRKVAGGEARDDFEGSGVQTATLGIDRDQVVRLTPAEEKLMDIETVKATRAYLKCILEAAGKVLAPQHRKAIVSYAFPARIAEIHVRVGDWVTQGQKLVTLQSEEVGNAKSEFYKAQADYELAKINSDREKRLHDRGVGAKKNFLTTQTELKVAETNLDAAEKKLHLLGFSEEQVRLITQTHQINPVITLFSPISGKIIENKGVVGAMIDQSTEVLIIMDPTMLWIDADIYEKDIAKIKTGQNVEATVPAYPGEIFRGKTSYISDVLNEETRTITVRTEVQNKDNRLKVGMFAAVKIHLNHQSEALVVPENAVLDDKGKAIVFIKKDGACFPRNVTTGTREGGYIEIIAGLSPGDEVVTQGNFQLKSKLYEDILHEGHVH
jgi:cobalt-zinc-cadmium efflux system membrane fusion protein